MLINVDPKEYAKSGMSEYELYFNFMLLFCPDKLMIRKLIFENSGISVNEINNYKNKLHYISLHNYLRINETNQNTLIDFVSGEEIQYLCDLTIITKDILEFHNSLKKDKINYILLENYIKELDDHSFLDTKYKTIFVYTHILYDFLKYIFPFIQHNIIIVTHNSDHPIDEKILPFLDDNRIEHLFCQNLLIQHIKCTPIPIGIANIQWPHGNIDILKNFINTNNNQKINKLYVNLALDTNIKIRGTIFNQIKNKDFIYIENRRLNYNDYLEQLTKFKYILCIRGNGVDTHRLWETLYLGGIAIVDNNYNANMFSDKYKNIITINDFNNLTLNELETTKLNNNDKLDYPTLSYYDLLIKNKKKSLLKLNHHLVFIYLGNIPSYIKYCFQQVRLWNPNINIYFCHNSSSLTEEIKILLNEYDIISVKI
jgi:hypothetical protein